METVIVYVFSCIGVILVIVILLNLYKMLYSNLTEQEVYDLMVNRTNNNKIDNKLFKKKEKHFRNYLKRLNYFTKNSYTININQEHLITDSVKQLNEILNEQFINSKLFINVKDKNNIDTNKNIEEWIKLVVLDILDPIYGIFTFSSGCRSKIKPFYGSMIVNNHLSYFYFLGKILAMILIENYKIWIPLERSVYNFLLGYETTLEDVKIIDEDFYRSILRIKKGDMSNIELFFSDEIDYFGVYFTVDLILNGSNIRVTNENKEEYLKLLIKFRYETIIFEQLETIKKGFYEIIEEKSLSIFSSSELKNMICGIYSIDIQDWKTYTKYYNDFSEESFEIVSFWSIVENFSYDYKLKLFEYWTGSKKVPYGGIKNCIKNEKFVGLNIKKKNHGIFRFPSTYIEMNELYIYYFFSAYEFEQDLLAAMKNRDIDYGYIFYREFHIDPVSMHNQNLVP